MSISSYKISNNSTSTKLFGYASGSTEPGDSLTITVSGNSFEVVESFIEPFNILLGTSESEFTSDSYFPTQPGYAWLWNDGSKVKYIKIHHKSTNGLSLSPYIDKTKTISFSMLGAKDGNGNFMYNPTSSRHLEDYYLNNSTRKGNYNFLSVLQPPSSRAVSDISPENRDFNFGASGSYSWYATSSGTIAEPISSSGYSASIAQGFFPKNISDFGTRQFIRGWANANYYNGDNLVPTDGGLLDVLNNFNTGSTERDFDQFLPYSASTLPWFIDAPSSSFYISSASFGTYTGQNRSVRIGPSFTNTSSDSDYGEAIYGNPNFEYGGTGAQESISYYYKEDTNQILVDDPNNIIDEDKRSDITLYPSLDNTTTIVNINNPQTYTTDEGFEIPIENGSQLILYRGKTNQNLGIGDDNLWNYNRYLHRPYKIYMVTQTGSNDNPSNIKEAYVVFSSSLAEDRIDGRYVFETEIDTTLGITASINLTASNALPIPPSEYGDADYGENVYGGGSIPPNQTWQTASLELYIANPGQSIGALLVSSSLYIDDINTDNFISLSSSIFPGQVTPGTSLRLAVAVDTGSISDNVNSSLIVTNYTMSIDGPAPKFSDLIPTYIDNILDVPEDCNPFAGNATEGRPSSIRMETDYSSGSIPVNLEQILDGTAKKADTPDSNYTIRGLVNSKYIGSHSTSQFTNVFTEGDIATYGRLSTVDINKAFSGYFNRIFDTYPLLNQKTSFEVKYVIDENGNAAQPRIGDFTFFNLQGSLSEGEDIKVAVTDKEKEILYDLNGLKNVFKVGTKPTPILYSQVAARAYTSSIFITGKVPLNNDPITFNDYSYTATDTVINTDTNKKSINEIKLSPNNVISGSEHNVTSSYVASTGDTTLPVDDYLGILGSGSGKALSDTYNYVINYEFETSNLVKSRTQNGTVFRPSKHTQDVGDFYLFIKKNNSNAKVSIISLDLQVIFINNNSSTGEEVRSFNALTNLSQDVTTSGNQLKIHFHAARIQNLLRNNGIDGYRSDIREGGNLLKMRWVLEVELDSTIVQGDLLQTFVEGEMHNADGGVGQNYFNYAGPQGTYPSKTNVSLALNGSKSLPGQDVSASYWEFSGSNFDTLVMPSENGNEAYGRKGFKQQYFTYGSGSAGSGSYNGISGSGAIPWDDRFTTNSDFSSGFEPDFLGFPQVTNDWSLKVGDEIRFENDESQTYKIIEVFPPFTQTPIGEEKKGRLKIVVNRNIDTNIDLNFFLIRRYIQDEGNLIIDFPKPYGVPIENDSATGLLFPKFPVKELSVEPDQVLRNLLEQKLIE